MAIVSPADLEAEARRRLDPAVYDFYAGGADDELTLRANEAAFARISLLPRVLCGRSSRDLSVQLLGRRLDLPVLVAPTAFHRLAHPDGELATAQAVAKTGTIMIASMASTVRVEDIGTVATDRGFQLYIQPDLEFTELVVRRAEQAGCCALVVSVDSPVFGRRERDLRNGFRELPPGMFCENMRDPADGGQPRRIVFSPGLSWSDIDWLRGRTGLPIVLKGIAHPADAWLAVEHGVAAVVVSNHGGRQLDTMPAAIDLLAPVADAVGGRIPVLMDGGIRRGTDVVKALALGADAVAIGRPVLWGLAVAGVHGVLQVLQNLRSELDNALALCGCGSVREVTRELVRLPGGGPC
jgi:4-hydroxymandelate oxidase